MIDAIGVARRGNAKWNLKASQNVGGARDWLKRRREGRSHGAAQLGEEGLGQRISGCRAIVADGGGAAAEKPLHGGIEVDLDGMPSQAIDKRIAAQKLAIDQHPVAIENDELVAARAVPAAIPPPGGKVAGGQGILAFVPNLNHMLTQ